MLDSELSTALEGDESESEKSLLKSRRSGGNMKPLYLQAATEFCDLHDKTGRMTVVGVIRDAVPWDRSREYFYNRVKHRMIEDMYYYKRMVDASDGDFGNSMAMAQLMSMANGG